MYRRLPPKRLTDSRPDYPQINTSNELDALPDGSIVMMDPDTTTSPVLWTRLGPLWVKLDPLARPGERDEAWSIQLFRRTLTRYRPRKLVLLWMPPRG